MKCLAHLALLALAGGPALVAAQAESQPIDRAALLSDHSALDQGQPDWDALTLQVGRHWGARQLAEFELTETRRFGQRDTEVALAGALPLSAQWTGSLRAHASDTHRVLPRFGIGGSLQYEFARGWLLHGAFKHTSYSATDVNQASLILERYVGAWSFLGVLHAARALGEHTQAGELRATWFYGDRSSVGAIIAAGDEATQVGPSLVAVAHVRSAALVGRHALDDRWLLRWGLHDVRQGRFYTRTGFSLGVERDF